MGDKSAIEWTNSTWNPVVGCSVISPGCKYCYAMRLAARLERMGVEHYAGLTIKTKAGAVWNGKVGAAPRHLILQPTRWGRPRRIFVNSMSDLFHEDMPEAAIDDAFAVMALAAHHEYQVLTKRSDRMRAYFDDEYRWALIEGAAQRIHQSLTGEDPSEWLAVHGPLPNVLLGVSVEDRARAARLDALRATEAARRFVSAEPLLEDLGDIDLTGIDWLICGGESGPGARPMHPDWARSLRDRCAKACVPFFFKQWGDWLPCVRDDDGEKLVCYVDDGGAEDRLDDFPGRPVQELAGQDMWRVGKKAAGATLDGREHREFPNAR